jgi:Leu/Phe-tRNA-protein transferase
MLLKQTDILNCGEAVTPLYLRQRDHLYYCRRAGQVDTTKYGNKTQEQKARHKMSINSPLFVNPEASRLFFRGVDLYLKGDIDEALETYTRSIMLYDGISDAFHNRGLIYARKGMSEEAIDDFTRTIELSPCSFNAFYNRGHEYRKQRQYDKAKRDYIEATALYYPGEDAEKIVGIFTDNEKAEAVEFAVTIIKNGFYLCVQDDLQDILISPMYFRERAILFFDRLHTGKTILRHLKNYGERYELRVDTDFDSIVDNCAKQHGTALLTSSFVECVRGMQGKSYETRPVSFSLYLDKKLVAGDIGIQTGRIYTSYTGYHDLPSSGTVQLILMSRWLEQNAFAFLDLGPGLSDYKKRLGAVGMEHTVFKQLFHRWTGPRKDSRRLYPAQGFS